MIQHKELAEGRWKDLSLCEQMANIGSEVSRTIKWKEKQNLIQSQKAIYHVSNRRINIITKIMLISLF